MEKITFDVEHELPGGMFDKDEQGWCCSREHVQCKDGEHVSYRYYYDANGRIVNESKDEGKIIEERGGIVTIKMNKGHVLYYSLSEKKLIKI